MADHVQRTSSSGGMVTAVQNANKVHEWPDEAGDCSAETWAIYVKNQCFRAFDDWNEADLFELGRISRLQSMVVNEMNILEDEGLIQYGGKTGLVPVENPRNRAVSTLNSTITATLRRLGITSSNSGGDRTAKTNRAAQERKVRGVISQGDAGESDASGTAFI